MNLRTTELGMPVEVFNVIINVAHYGLVIIPCSSEERAEWVLEKAYQKYVNVLDVDVQRCWLDEFGDELDWLH